MQRAGNPPKQPTSILATLPYALIHFHLWLLCLVLAACSADRPLNPTFPLKMADAKIAWKQMEGDPKPLERPVVVVGGIYDPGIFSKNVACRLRTVTAPDSRIIHVAYFNISSFDRCAQVLIEAVDREFPTDDPDQTIAVDVIGYSMGGLVARYAASDRAPSGAGAEGGAGDGDGDGDGGARVSAPARSGRRLQIHTLYTVSTPHVGARLAWVPTFDRRIIDMRPGSEFLTKLNQAAPAYEIVPYARLGDVVVGAENAAPVGRTAWWLAKPWSFSHLLAAHDVRILADIARRLRGEQPFTAEPAAPLP